MKRLNLNKSKAGGGEDKKTVGIELDVTLIYLHFLKTVGERFLLIGRRVGGFIGGWMVGVCWMYRSCMHLFFRITPFLTGAFTHRERTNGEPTATSPNRCNGKP